MSDCAVKKHKLSARMDVLNFPAERGSAEHIHMKQYPVIPYSTIT